MAPRHICPSMGSLRRSLYAEAIQPPRCSARAFSSSAQRLEEQPGNKPQAAAASNTPNRRARSEIALKQITNLQNRRVQPGGLAKGNFPSGQMAQRRTPQTNNSGSPPNNTSGAATGDGSQRPRMAKFPGRPPTPQAGGAPGAQMVRASNTLKITRTAGPGGMKGPNLAARRTGPSRGGPRGKKPGGPPGTAKREKKEGGSDAKEPTTLAEIDPAATLSDGMVHHLLRLQRKEWDRVPYEPKYTHGSLAAQQLIHEGRELFKGESAPVKVWGELERRIGVVGMHNAAAHLKVRRVLDGDEAPFGQEDAQEGKAELKAPAA